MPFSATNPWTFRKGLAASVSVAKGKCSSSSNSPSWQAKFPKQVRCLSLFFPPCLRVNNFLPAPGLRVSCFPFQPAPVFVFPSAAVSTLLEAFEVDPQGVDVVGTRGQHELGHLPAALIRRGIFFGRRGIAGIPPVLLWDPTAFVQHGVEPPFLPGADLS